MAEMLAIVGLGSNLAGDLESIDAQLVRAAEQLEATGAGRVAERSRMFATPPWGGVEQDDFRNATIAVRTDLEPLAFLHACQAIEQAAHRTREVRWGPRTLDVDVLALFALPPSFSSDDATSPRPASLPENGASAGDGQASGEVRAVESAGKWGEELIVPHPYAHERAFVLVPWTDLGVAEDPRFGLKGQPISAWLARVEAAHPQEVADVRPVVSPEWDAAR